MPLSPVRPDLTTFPDFGPMVVIDIETTGLDPTDAIIELAAVRVGDGEVTGQFTTLVKSSQQLPRWITKLTGIDDALLSTAPPLGQALRAFVDFLGSDPVVVSHNVPFDMGFLSRAFQALKLPWVPPICVDTLALARTVLPREVVGSYRLSSLAEYFNIDPPRSHRALADAYTCARVLVELQSPFEAAGGSGFDDLLSDSAPVPHELREHVHLCAALPGRAGRYRLVGGDGRTLYGGEVRNLRRQVRALFSPSPDRSYPPELTYALIHLDRIEID